MKKWEKIWLMAVIFISLGTIIGILKEYERAFQSNILFLFPISCIFILSCVFILCRAIEETGDKLIKAIEKKESKEEEKNKNKSEAKEKLCHKKKEI